MLEGPLACGVRLRCQTLERYGRSVVGNENATAYGMQVRGVMIGSRFVQVP